MPRRAAKKPDPALDLSRHLLRVENLPIPCEPTALFDRAASMPVELEVGSGKGLFLFTAARADSSRAFIGCEIALGYARLAAARLAREGLANARMLHGDAGTLVRCILPDRSLEAVHVYFPDPWWKARHRKRRVLSSPFLAHVARLLPAGGRLHVWTDVEEYYRETLGLADAIGCFDPVAEEAAAAPRHDLDYRTHFERRTRLAGAPVWRGLLVRNVCAAPVTRADPPGGAHFHPAG